jgi:uncharacterized protein YkwD
VVVLLGAGAATAIHSNSTRLAITPAQAQARNVQVAVYSGDDLTPGNQPHTSPTFVPPAPSARPPAVAPARPPAAPRPAISVGSYQQSLINRDRAGAGLGPLTWSSCLARVAASNAVRLSRQGWVQPYHTNGPSLDLGCHLGNRAGENVGYWSGGINDGQLNAMFMNSSEHYANIMGPYHYVATAWAVAPNGAAYIAVEFS